MLTYVLRRIIYMIPTVIVISMVSFVMIQLPPGDFVDKVASQLQAQSGENTSAMEEQMRERYGLNQPMYVQYFKWSRNVIKGEFGYSFLHDRPAEEVMWDRLSLTLILSISTLLFQWVVAIPIGIYSAVKQYSIGDYIATTLGFIGLATPNFLLALVIMYISFRYFGQSVSGLFSPEYRDAPWSLARIWDMMKHLWIPMVIVGTSGTAGLIRTLRANLLDEMNKPYVVTARAKGLTERRLLLKYPVRHAMNPFVSTVGWSLPALISGAAIVAIVLNLPTTGPLLLTALLNQDMYLAAGFIFTLSILTVIGTLLSDLLLAWLDPRIRYE